MGSYHHTLLTFDKPCTSDGCLSGRERQRVLVNRLVDLALNLSLDPQVER